VTNGGRSVSHDTLPTH